MIDSIQLPIVVSFSEMINSLSCLQENLDSGKLQKLMEQLNDSSIHREPIELCYTGLMCLGRYSEDRQLRRAVVSKVLTDGADLLFIDFGNSETVPFSEIYKLPAQ